MLPLQLRKELGDALVRLAPQPIAEATDRVSERDAPLGAALTGLAKRFADTRILNALQDCHSRLRQETNDRQL